jgi:sensor histidine kinase YesM
MKGFIRWMEETEAKPAVGNFNYRMIASFEPDFLQYSLTYNHFSTYCIYIIREIKTFNPYTRIGHILLTMPVSALKEPLAQFSDSNFSYLLVHPDGNIIYSDDETGFGEKFSILEPRINLKLEAGSGFFTGIYRGQKSMISYKTSDYSGITLVTATPLTFIYRNAYLFLTVLIAIFSIGVFIVVALSWRYTKTIIKPIHLLSAVMSNFSKENIRVQLPVTREDEAGKLTEAFNTMTKKISDLIFSEYESTIKLRTAELRQKETQLQYLRAQINPHFLYNTLDNIRIKAALNNDNDVADMIMLLVEFFRGNMEQNSHAVPIAHELNLIEIYLNLMRYRYPNLKVEFDLDGELKDIEIPSMILQPIVENSLLHGLKSVNYKGKITISVYRDKIQKDIIIITISDNGKGISREVREKLEKSFMETESDKKQSHIGIINIQQRLRMFYPAGCGLFYEDNPEGGVCVVIKIKDHIEQTGGYNGTGL